MNKNRYLCLHLHFYQPPRENPWLGDIELQESAYPFHDWNERINIECYRSNAMSRILNRDGQVVDLANNYAKTSFNFGPTLLTWLEEKDPSTYQKILDGDRLSREHFGGHGSAIAQGYNHVIMPLASWRDKETQILWGLRDFEKRFGRMAESLWLPETAVDIDSLEIMAANGMKYVILAPRQARAVRRLGSDETWQDVSGERVDPLKPYLIYLPSGRSIAAFFYNGAISKAVAFEGLLHNGETFANRLISGFDSHRDQNQLLHIATDGETYGHHHRHGDMALAYALWYLQKKEFATITNYGQYLESHPPTDEAQIFPSSSWSCEHGVDRWYRDCGCATGAQPTWNQAWRGPLRKSFNFIQEKADPAYENLIGKYGVDPWALRNDYIELIFDRSLANIETFFRKWFPEKNLGDQDVTAVLKALEVQKHLLFMYTSCAWFFDDVSGIEAVQNLQYAYRAMELCQSVFDLSLEDEFLIILDRASSNVPFFMNGREVFERLVRPAKVDFFQIGVHFAMASLFEKFGETNEIFNSKITLIDFKSWNSGKSQLVCGHARIRARSTLERQQIVFAVMHMGDHNVTVGVKKFESNEIYISLFDEAKNVFLRGDFHETVRVLDRHFGKNIYSLRDLVKDERLRFTSRIMDEALVETEERFHRIYQSQYPLMSYLANINMTLPKVFLDVAEFMENRNLRRELKNTGKIDIKKMRNLLEESSIWKTHIDHQILALDLQNLLVAKTQQYEATQQANVLEEIADLLDLHVEFPWGTDLGCIQDWFFTWHKNHAESAKGQERLLERLATRLQVQIGRSGE